MDLPSLFPDKYNLGGIGTVGRSNDPLAKPSVKTFAHFSLKLPRIVLCGRYTGLSVLVGIVWVNLLQ